ncbi:rhodanese-like domain-containing protein [Candidatus Gottesmanbacteria bacterium]|nr:rhodanese-like domain-containing protein [Candidatus Gottesmanbacteria bacterium]
MDEITATELKDLLDSGKGVTLLDCRRAEVYRQEHIPGAINAHWSEVVDKAPAVLSDKNKIVVTYCSGFTFDASVRCYENLKALGYTNLKEYAGGITDWKAHGYETVKEDGV